MFWSGTGGLPILNRLLSCRFENATDTGGMEWFIIILSLFVVFYLVLPKLNQVPLDQAAMAIKEGAPLIDVRTSREFSQQSIPGSKNYPLARFSKDIEQAGYAKDQTIILFCLSGSRSASAVRQLKAMGYSKVMNVGSINRAQKALDLSQKDGSE